jgi:hypothetical protein
MISQLEKQVWYRVEPPGCDPIRLCADFQYLEGGRLVVEEWKAASGATTDRANVIAWKLLRARHPEVTLRISARSRGRTVFVREWISREAVA